jgi:DNA-binding winged helix-turn-helix (wHTH) protein
MPGMTAASDAAKLGPFSIDFGSATLSRDGVNIPLRPQAFHVLQALLESSGKYLDHDAMIRAAWRGTLVSRHTVAVTVSEVKKALDSCGSWVSFRPKLGYRLEIPPTEDLVKTGLHLLSRRTREGIEKALVCFEEAAAENPADARVWQGLSHCYLTLGTYAMRRPREVYPRFLEAHARAVELAGMTPALRADRAHGLHMFERRFADAEKELLRAYREGLRTPAAGVRLAMLYASLGRMEDALSALKEVSTIDPLHPGLLATEVSVLFFGRDYEQAVQRGKKAVDLHPYMQLARFYYGLALEYTGRGAEAQDQYRTARLMSPDLPWLRSFEARYLARKGETAEAARMIEELEDLRQTEYVEPYNMALLREALGDRGGALRELEQAYLENSTVLNLLNVDPRMDDLRADPCFVHLRHRFEGPGAGEP